MSFSQADLHTLDRAIASGTLKVRVDGKEVTYRSMDELRFARKFVADQLAAQSGSGRATFVNPAFDRGV